MVSFSVERKFDMPLDKLWPMLSDFTKSPAPDDVKVFVEKEGDPGKHGAGLVRRATIGKDKVRQHLISVDPPHFYTYQIIDHPLMKEYRARVDFKEEEEGTSVRYQVDIKPAFPLTGKIVCAKCKAGTNFYFDAVEKYHFREQEKPGQPSER